jgi:imidazole glycerol-phosphate synthase subunit HisH
MITIVNYGLGNVRAIANLYRKLHVPVEIATEARDIEKAAKLILPGVGAFDFAMQRLEQSGMRHALDDMVLHRKVAVLGICVGMQILCGSSEEGVLPGLGWIDAEVRKFDFSTSKHVAWIPHMGWNHVRAVKANGLFHEMANGSRFYFLHSYYVHCRKDDVIAVTDYGGEFACAVNSGNIYGVQFHPEKSHQWGIQLLKNFAERV